MVTRPLAEGIDRERVREDLAKNGVATAAYFEPIHQQLGWNQMNGGKLTVAESVGRRTLALPFFTRISEEQQESVASSFATALGKR